MNGKEMGNIVAMATMAGVIVHILRPDVRYREHTGGSAYPVVWYERIETSRVPRVAGVLRSISGGLMKYVQSLEQGA